MGKKRPRQQVQRVTRAVDLDGEAGFAHGRSRIRLRGCPQSFTGETVNVRGGARHRLRGSPSPFTGEPVNVHRGGRQSSRGRPSKFTGEAVKVRGGDRQRSRAGRSTFTGEAVKVRGGDRQRSRAGPSTFAGEAVNIRGRARHRLRGSPSTFAGKPVNVRGGALQRSRGSPSPFTGETVNVRGGALQRSRGSPSPFTGETVNVRGRGRQHSRVRPSTFTGASVNVHGGVRQGSRESPPAFAGQSRCKRARLLYVHPIPCHPSAPSENRSVNRFTNPKRRRGLSTDTTQVPEGWFGSKCFMARRCSIAAEVCMEWWVGLRGRWAPGPNGASGEVRRRARARSENFHGMPPVASPFPRSTIPSSTIKRFSLPFPPATLYARNRRGDENACTRSPRKSEQAPLRAARNA